MSGPINQDGLAIALPHAVLHVLDEAQRARGALALRRVSLTFPDAALSDWPDIATSSRDSAAIAASWVWQAADLFASQIEAESEPHAGALLVLDLTERTLRPHWYGLALTTRDDFATDQLWHKLAHHTPTRDELQLRVRALTGQAASWSPPAVRWTGDEHARAAYVELCSNVHRSCRYACKPLPLPVTLPLSERIVLSGRFEKLLGKYIGRTVGDAAAQLAQQLGRSCLHCGKPLPVGMRRHAKRHETCRKLAHKARRKACEVSP